MLRDRLIEERFFDAVYPVSGDRVLIEGPHAGGPAREYYTGFIVWELLERFGWGGIISRTSRELVDFNRDRNWQGGTYQREGIEKRDRALKELIERLGWSGHEPLLYLSLHGLSNGNSERIGADFVVGTRNGELCPASFRDRFLQKLSGALEMAGAPSRGRKEVPQYAGHPSLMRLKERFGPNLFIIQLELSLNLRKNFTLEVISALFLTIRGVLR